MEGFELFGQIMQILPNSASSAAHILMQSAFSSALIGEEPVSGVLHTIHTPLSSIDGKRIQIASLYMAECQTLYYCNEIRSRKITRIIQIEICVIRVICGLFRFFSSRTRTSRRIA